MTNSQHLGGCVHVFVVHPFAAIHGVVLASAGGIVVLHPQTEFVNFPDAVTKLLTR